LVRLIGEGLTTTLDPVDTAAERLPATDGRMPGRRGQATRRKLLDTTAALLGTTSYRNIKVIDIAREAGTSPATFYQYFPDVEQAVLVLAEEVAHDAVQLTQLVRGDWRPDAGAATARALVEGFMDFWEGHRSVLRVVDLATEEGDLRFQRLRVRALNALTESLREAIAGQQAAGNLDANIDPMATAGVLVSMLAHVGSHRYGFEFWGIRTAKLIESLTRILHWTVTGSG
jgi:AcrR family transcriptional regulator